MQPNNSLLIVEDDSGLARQLRWHFEGLSVHVATTVDQAIECLTKHRPKVVLQDLGLPPNAEGVDEGFRCIQSILDIDPNCTILVMTGKSEETNALRAIGLGAQDFFHKPVNPDQLDFVVKRAFETARLRDLNRHQGRQAEDIEGEIRTTDPTLQRICRQLKKLAGTEITCTLIGESGVGKEVFANTIHRHSQRHDQHFQAINCAAIPENLIESELFGYEKGAFTGAAKTTAGKIESANLGTLFLDEIGDMPLLLQTKLLRFLQERTIQRVGSTQDIPVDVRVVCATNRDLKAMVAEGSFREDLYYRICEFELQIPPLRDRGHDKLTLAEFFVTQTVERYGLNQIQGLSASGQAAVLAYHWPGNVRELESKIKTACVMSDNTWITAEDLQLDDQPDRYQASENGIMVTRGTLPLKEARKLAEVSAIRSALSEATNITEAAKLLKVSRPTLYDMIAKYEINETVAN